MRRLTLTLALLALAGMAWAELGGVKFVSSSAGADTRTVNASTLLVINDGASTIHVRVFWEGETPADATQTSPDIKPGEALSYHKDFNIIAISVISESSSTVRLQYW